MSKRGKTVMLRKVRDKYSDGEKSLTLYEVYRLLCFGHKFEVKDSRGKEDITLETLMLIVAQRFIEKIPRYTRNDGLTCQVDHDKMVKMLIRIISIDQWQLFKRSGQRISRLEQEEIDQCLRMAFDGEVDGVVPGHRD